MNNKKISLYKESLTLGFQNNNQVKEGACLIKPSENTLRKAKGFPSATSVWSNSVYSFNKNYLKNIPAADNAINKIIKSFFSINPLATNPKGKKSRLVQRRYKRLSLNKILVSKSEIKHTSDKVFITVYLFNKKKRSLLLKLKNLYNSLYSTTGNKIKPDKFYSVTRPSFLNTNITSKPEKSISLINSDNLVNNTKLGFFPTHYNINRKTNIHNKYNAWNKYNNKLNVLSSLLPLSPDRNSSTWESNKVEQGAFYKNSTSYNNKYKIIVYKLDHFVSAKRNIKRLTLAGFAGLASKAFFNKYGFVGLTSIKSGQKNTNNLFLKNVLYYKNLNNLTRSNIHSFIASLGLNQINTINLNNLFKHLNKYKLYNNENNINLTLDIKSLINDKRFIKSNYSIYKLKSMYKLFVLYNNINSINNMSDIYSKKILLNTYKLLKKSLIKLDNGLIKGKNTNLSSNFETDSKLTPNKSYSNIRKNLKNVILINKLNRIDRFINKYKNILDAVINPASKEKTLFEAINTKNTSNSGTKLYSSSINSQVINTYKINFINNLLEKELLYVYYLKLLSYNNAIFKNWFLFPLRNIVSKIYNKKVVFNLVNLKYMHLNSDILSQAVNIRLRNFKKNRVVKVLKKVIKLVPISKVNIYACDEHSPIYKYVQNYHNKFKTLKLEVFKEIGIFSSINGSILKKKNSLDTNTMLNTPDIKIKGLNHIQYSTMNFIKYKSVFGVRLEAAGRLTKRSTASRSIFKFRYNGTLRNNPIINNSISSVMVKNNRISNLQFTKIASKTRNGSFGLKGWINNN